MFIGTTYCNGGWISVIKYYLEIYNRLTMSKKQTAVQWLIENAKGFHNAESSKAMQEEALQMEREQMLEASISGSDGHSFEIFYNNTFKP